MFIINQIACLAEISDRYGCLMDLHWEQLYEKLNYTDNEMEDFYFMAIGC